MGCRILIDALAARYGGTAYAAVQLARRLAVRPEVSTVLVVARRASIVERGLANEPGVRCIALPPAARMELIRRVAWEAVRLPGVVAREDVDVVVSMSGMLPRRLRCGVMCLLFNPVMYERGTAANLLRRAAVRRTARHALYTAAPSHSMASLASASTGRKCAVVPLGVDHSVFRPAAVPGERILYVADFYAHKRHELVLDAWLLLPSPRPALHLVGQPAVDPQTYARLRGRIETLPEADSIVMEHEITLDRLVSAYRGARVFVMASEHESFCMPLVESLACGVPAVARDLPSLRETGGDAARYIDGNDPNRWSAAIRRLIENDCEHEQAREIALRTAAPFSWDALADALATHL
jgi:glycosyltransferase involved in cell wall biosynthesis